MKKISLYLLVVLYIAAGVNHFIHPEFYKRIMPSWIPFHHELIFISGACEVLFAVLLLFTATRRIAAWCIIALLIAVFPANIQMMFDYIHTNDPKTWITIVRLPVQVLFVWWAYSFAKPDKENKISFINKHSS